MHIENSKITPILLLIYLLFPALTCSGETMENIYKDSIVFWWINVY